MATRSLTAQFETACVRPRAGRTLIVGSKVYGGRADRRVLYKEALGIDLFPGEGVDRVLDLEEPLPACLGKFMHAECWSVLEHSRRPWLLAHNIEELLVVGGTLFIKVPFIWRIHNYPNDYWRFTLQGVRLLFPRIKWAALECLHTMEDSKGRVPTVLVEGHQFLARTEIHGFGVAT